MKRLLSILLCFAVLLTFAACNQYKMDPAEANKIVIWHDKEEAVIAAMENYLNTKFVNLLSLQRGVPKRNTFLLF